MTLEDHAGDIVRKARLMCGCEAQAVAESLGWTVEALSEFEDSGKAEAAPDFSRLPAELGLEAGKLRRVFGGWTPSAVDLRRWRELRQVTTAGRGMAVHAYLAWDEATREAALFDTGFDAGPVLALAAENQLELKHIFVTHSHHDHLAGLEAVRARFPKAHLRTNSKAAPIAHWNRPTDFIHCGSLRISNRATPGHAEDGVTYVIGNFPDDVPSVAVVGDALFAGSMGGARGLGELARSKVREQILSLPPDTLICPGHGPLTTVREEMGANPFF